MLRIGFRLVAVLVMLTLDACAAWGLLSAAASFVSMEWIAASDTPLGRAVWLALFVYVARDSIPDAIRVADRHMPKAPAS